MGRATSSLHQHRAPIAEKVPPHGKNHGQLRPNFGSTSTNSVCPFIGIWNRGRKGKSLEGKHGEERLLETYRLVWKVVMGKKSIQLHNEVMSGEMGLSTSGHNLYISRAERAPSHEKGTEKRYKPMSTVKSMVPSDSDPRSQESQRERDVLRTTTTLRTSLTAHLRLQITRIQPERLGCFPVARE